MCFGTLNQSVTSKTSTQTKFSEDVFFYFLAREKKSFCKF